MTNQPLVGIVIVTMNNASDIRECLSSLLEQDYTSTQTLVVDNASSDDTSRIVQEEFPSVQLRVMKNNILLSPANNFGIKEMINECSPKYIMVLNPDTKLSSNLVGELVKSLEIDQSAFAAGPKVIFYKTKNEGLINSAGLLYDGFIQAYDRGFEQKDLGQFDVQEYVFGVTGACILFRSETLQKVGLYYERIKLYMDEVEMFIRAQKHGLKVIYNPKATLYHKYMKSSDQLKISRINKVKKDAWLWIALKHYPLKGKLAMIRHYLTSK